MPGFKSERRPQPPGFLMVAAPGTNQAVAMATRAMRIADALQLLET